MLLVLFALFSLAHSADPEESFPGVYDLTPDNFDSVVNGKKGALVEFYAPWCGHCVGLAPEMKKLGETVESDPMLKNRVVVAKVNADKHSELGEEHGISGFPTIKYFPRGGGEPEDYAGGRKAKNIANYLKKKVEEDRGLGRVEQLDEIVKDFLSSSDKAGIAKAVADKVKTLEGEDKENGQTYVIVLEKAVAKGDDYVSSEKARLEKVLSSGSVNSEKAVEMMKKASILRVLSGEADN